MHCTAICQKARVVGTTRIPIRSSNASTISLVLKDSRIQNLNERVPVSNNLDLILGALTLDFFPPPPKVP